MPLRNIDNRYATTSVPTTMSNDELTSQEQRRQSITEEEVPDLIPMNGFRTLNNGEIVPIDENQTRIRRFDR